MSNCTSGNLATRPLNVLVCGANYGAAYLDAMGLRPDRFRLAGLLARGSDRSRKLSDRHGVPLYLAPEQLPAAIDVACAAMGTSAHGTVLALLRRGIHVLCEHPVGGACAREALAAAAANGVSFHVNGHFADLPAPRAFITRARSLANECESLFVRILAADRSLWGNLDIAGRALRGWPPFRVERVTHLGSFAVVTGWAGPMPAVLQLQLSRDSDPMPADGSPAYVADFCVSLGFSAGILTLSSIAGPVLWNANYAQARSTGELLWQALEADPLLTAARLYRQRTLANLLAIERLVNHAIEGIVPFEQRAEYLLGLSAAWDQIAAALHQDPP